MMSTTTSTSNTNNNNQEPLEEDQALLMTKKMTPLISNNGETVGGIREGLLPQEKHKVFALMKKHIRASWGSLTQQAQDAFDKKQDYKETERLVTQLLEEVDTVEAEARTKLLSQETQEKVFGKKLFWTLYEKFARHARGQSRMRCQKSESALPAALLLVDDVVPNYQGALEDFDMVLDMMMSSCTEENKPPSIDDHKFAVQLLFYRVECYKGLMDATDAAAAETETTNSSNSSSSIDDDTITLLYYLEKSIADLKEIFEKARSAETITPSSSNSDEQQEKWIEFYITYHARKKILEGAIASSASSSSSANTNGSSSLQRPMFTAEELRSMEEDVGKPLFVQSGASYTCTHCGASGIIPNRTTGQVKKLHLCSGCRQSWYCGVDCQKRNWKAHKLICGKTAPWFLDDSERGAFQNWTAPSKVLALKDNNTGEYSIYARDPSTGRFFNCITNMDIYFVPSEEAAMQALLFA